MRNYIILNDINSNTINGLLIQQLPPISKPKMRTQVETIDGRAGDIITQLGFSAYDKTIEIGLYGDFDINEVISYFNSSGQVVFSNEPDKYYNYQIVDQIDYERLIRFRTAKVKMHCQPFKYPTEEEPLVGQYQYVSDTGSNLSLNNTANALFKKIGLKGNPSGTVNGNNIIYVEGKNLYNPKYRASNNNFYGVNCTITETDGTFNLTATGNDMYMWQIRSAGQTYDKDLQGQLFKFDDDEYTITISNTSMIANYITFFDENNISLGFISFGGVGYTKTFKRTDSNVPANAKYFTLRIGYNNATIGTTYSFTIQVEKGSSSTSYELYVGTGYPIYLGVKNLININSNSFSTQTINGVTITNNDDGSFTLDGTSTGAVSLRVSTPVNDLVVGTYVYSPNNSGTLSGGSATSIVYGKNANSSAVQLLANGNTTPSTFTTTAQYDECYLYLYVGEGRTFTNYVYKPQLEKGSKANSYTPYGTTPIELGENDEIVNINGTYYINDSSGSEITDENLISQLDALNQAVSHEGQTNISQDYNTSPFILDVAAVQSGSDELTVDNEGNFYSRPTLDLEGTGIVDIYLNGNQMFQVDLTDTNEIVIDTDEMEAYNPTTSALMNRQVTGNYDNFKLNVGDNTLKFSGDLTKATITGYVRWL